METVIVGMNELTSDLKKVVKKFPDAAGDFLRKEGLQTRKEVVKNMRRDTKTKNKSKYSLGKIGSYRVSQVQGFGENMRVEIVARSPHFHLVERGHALVRPFGKKFKERKVKFKDGGKVIGRVEGKFSLKKAKETEQDRFPEMAEQMLDTLLKQCGL